MRSLITPLTAFLLFFCAITYTHANGTDSLYARKIAKIPNLGISYNATATDYINDYINNAAQTAEAIGRYQYYKPIIDSALSSVGLPTEVGLVILAASDADCFFEEENGNKGPWAMQYKVARMYGLKMNTYVDERRDIEKTTTISAKYLKELFLIYNSWPMALAAFSTSTITLNKYIRKSGNTFNYWAMYDSLPAEGQKIVPAYIAALYIYNFYTDHGIVPKPFKIIASETIELKKWMSFEVMAPALRTTVDALQLLNPIFTKGIVPLSAKPYLLKLPKSSKPWYKELDELDYKPYSTNPYIEEVELEDKNLPKPKTDIEGLNGGDTIYHKVEAGQGLGSIAQKYGVTVEDIKKWNNLKRNSIHPNQRLLIVRKKED